MLVAVSGSRLALGSPVRVSQGIKDSSATLKYYKRKRSKGHGEKRKESRKEGKEAEDSRGRDHQEAWRLILQISV